MRGVPASSEKAIADATAQREKMEKQKVKEEEKLKEVMESLKEETSGLQQDKEVCFLYILLLASKKLRYLTLGIASIKLYLPSSNLSCCLSCDLQTKEKELMGLSKAVNETRSRMDLAQSELDIYLSRHNTALTQLNTAKQTLDTTSNTLRERRAAIKDLEVKIPQIEQELKKVTPKFMLFGILCDFFFFIFQTVKHVSLTFWTIAHQSLTAS